MNDILALVGAFLVLKKKYSPGVLSPTLISDVILVYNKPLLPTPQFLMDYLDKASGEWHAFYASQASVNA